ncbi:MAG: hypothetical protein ACJASV_001712 [Pseudorhodobacter sp.]|jgi:hypothetical protein
MMMQAEAVKLFLEGRKVYAFEPVARKVFAIVDYGLDGRCAVLFSTGKTDTGVYGFTGNAYWTRYEAFRSGESNAFHLKSLGPGIAQAYFTNGVKAFVQSHSADLAGILEA